MSWDLFFCKKNSCCIDGYNCASSIKKFAESQLIKREKIID